MFQDLHQLIQTLTEKEAKRLNHFLTNSTSEGAFQYQLLFACLLKMGEAYDLEQLEDFRIENQIDEETLRVNSYHLYDHILFYLRDPKIRPDPVWKIQCLLKDAELLEFKHLPDLCLRKLETALSIAKENHLPEWENKILLTLSSFYLKQPDARVFKNIVESYELALLSWEKYKKSQEVIHHNHLVYQQWLLQATDFEELKQQMDPNATTIPTGLSIYAQLRYAQTRNIFAKADDDNAASLYWQKKGMEIFQQDEELKNNFPFEYLATIGNYQSAVFLSEEWGLFLQAWEELKQLKTEEPFLQSLRDALIILMRLNYLANHPQALREVQVTELDNYVAFIEDESSKISASMLTTIILVLAMVFFLRGNHVEARYWWQQIQIGRFNPIQPRKQRQISLLILLNDYADKNYDRNKVIPLVNTIRNRLRNLDPDNKELQGHEKIAIRYLRKLVKLPPRANQEEVKLLSEFHEALVQHHQETQDNGILTSNTIIWWLEMQLKQRSQGAS